VEATKQKEEKRKKHNPEEQEVMDRNNATELVDGG
jgi:hypothetical protein